MINKKLAPLVVIGCPTYSEKFDGKGKTGGGISIEWAGMWSNIQTPLGSIVTKKNVVDKIVDVARNDIVEHALSIGAEWVFFIADDVFVPHDTIMKMLSRDKEIVTGVYWTKEQPTHPYIWRGLEGPYEDWKVGEFFEVDFAGCDCLLVNTKVFKDIGYPYFSRDWTWFRDNNGKACKPGAINTEDFYFYARAKQLGYEIWCDTSIQCKHQDRRTGAMFGLQADMLQFTGKKNLESSDRLVAVIGSDKFQHEHIPGKHVRMDIREEVNPDLRCDVRDIPVDDQTYDVAVASHVLEHFPPSETVDCISEWTRILKVGGELIINVPNLEHAFKQILAGEQDQYYWQMIYGSQDVEFQQHKNGFVRWMLEDMFASSTCLSDVTIKDEGVNLKVRAKKVKHHEPLVLQECFDGNYVDQKIAERTEKDVRDKVDGLHENNDTK